MSREWKPGDVAMVTIVGLTERQMVRYDTGSEAGWYSGAGPAFTEGRTHYADIGGAKGATVRLLVVIDPEDREQVTRLAQAWDSQTHATLGEESMSLGAYRMQAALRSLVTPPKPEVLEHLAVEGWEAGSARALCGKVWRPDREAVTVAGRCPECAEMAKGGWVA